MVQERKRRAAARQADKVDAFQGWSKLKAVTEAAVRCLQNIDSPGEAAKRRAQERWLEVTKSASGGGIVRTGGNGGRGSYACCTFPFRLHQIAQHWGACSGEIRINISKAVTKKILMGVVGDRSLCTLIVNSSSASPVRADALSLISRFNGE